MDSPKEAEAAQALFCAIADYVGTNDVYKILNQEIYPTYWHFSGRPKTGKGYKNARDEIKVKLEKIQQAKMRELGDVQSHVKVNLKDAEEALMQQKITPRGKTLAEAQIDNQALIAKTKTFMKVLPVSLPQIEKFLDNYPTWYESSILIAAKLIKYIHLIDRDFTPIKSPNWQDFFYIRGGGTGGKTAMDNIETLFSIANITDKRPFGDVNKWSPADIYFASDAARKSILSQKKLAEQRKGAYDFDDLNSFVNQLIKSGHLLPLSLKKAKDQAEIKKYNFQRSKEEKYFASVEYERMRPWSTHKGPAGPKANIGTRNIEIYFKDHYGSKSDNIKIRHDPHHLKFGANHAIKIELEARGAGGRLGSMAWSKFILITQDVDEVFYNALQKFSWDKYDTAVANLNKKYKIEASDSHSKLAEQSILMTNPWNLKEKSKKPLKGLNMYEQYQTERAQLSALNVDNKIFPIIINYFNGKNGKPITDSIHQTQNLCSKIIANSIAYASSRSKQSGMFVIAK